jgi:hypothetical protein
MRTLCKARGLSAATVLSTEPCYSLPRGQLHHRRLLKHSMNLSESSLAGQVPTPKPQKPSCTAPLLSFHCCFVL